MGHLFDYGFLNSTTKEKAMEEGFTRATEFCLCNVDRLENPFGEYDNSFMYDSDIYFSEDEALDKINGGGAYMDGVCRIYIPTPSMEKKYQKSRDKIKDNIFKTTQKAKDTYLSCTSKTVGCKKCGKRVERQNHLYCPSCGEPLYAQRFKDRLLKLGEEELQLERDFKDALKERGKWKFWYKCEIHV